MHRTPSVRAARHYPFQPRPSQPNTFSMVYAEIEDGIEATHDAVHIQKPVVAAAEPLEVSAVVVVRLFERQKKRFCQRNERRDARGPNDSIKPFRRQP
jgi:hypothetical protein